MSPEAGGEGGASAGGTSYFDSHLHLTDDRLSSEAGVRERAREAGVTEMVTVGTSPDDARAAAELASAAEGVWAAAGLHPHSASRWSGAVRDALTDLLARPEVVAVGETGFDLHYENSPRGEQRRAFREQMELAADREMPLIVHSRDADGETAEVIRDYAGAVTGVLHCFTGGLALMQEALEAGWFVSFSGIVTFGGFEAEERVRGVPEERLLVETDSPYLAPAPERGRTNEPAFLPHTCRRVAELRDAGASAVAALTRRNARRFYGLA